MSRRWLILLVAALLVGGVPASGHAATQPRASLPDIEDEVMCPTCGVPLINAFSPQAEKERRFIRREIARGRTKAEIKDALVAQFGRTVLAVPRGHGFDLTAYLVPAVAIALAAAALAGGLVKRRRRGAQTAAPDADLSPADTSRLDRELSRYDL